MKAIFEAILRYIHENGLALYSSEKIIVDGKPFFLMSENDEDEKKDKGITLKWFVENKAKEGNELILKEDYDYFIFSDYNSVGIVETESMIEYLECENKENFVFSINKETREINIHFL